MKPRSARARPLRSAALVGLVLAACGGSSQDTTASTAVCDVALDEDVATTSGSFVLRNDRAVAVYVPQSVTTCTLEPFTLWEGGVQVYWAGWVPTCDQLLRDDCNWGCSDGPATAVRLEPGATWSVPWERYVWQAISLDDDCVMGTACESGSTCWAGRQRPSGPLSARVRVTETCDFSDTCDCGSAACELTADSMSIQAAATQELVFAFEAAATEITLPIQ